jgi:hypothetical protein
MSKDTATRSVSSFSDLPELYAEATATDDFTASFGDPMPLTIFEPDEPEEYEMPDPIAAQADCAGIITTISDLLTGTQLESVARELAWGMVNSFHFVAGKIERDADNIARQLGTAARELNGSEVFNRKLELAQEQCRILDEMREEVEDMCAYAAASYKSAFGVVWSPSRGSKVARSMTASQISALDFTEARRQRWREAHEPQGPCVIISGPSDWHDWEILFNRLSAIKALIPNMVLASTGGRTGVPAIAAAWAEKEHVPLVVFGLYGTAKNRAFKRNREMVAKVSAVQAVLCEGTGVQEHLYDLLNPERGRRVPTHVIMKADQAPAPPRRPSRLVPKGRAIRGPERFAWHDLQWA